MLHFTEPLDFAFKVPSTHFSVLESYTRNDSSYKTLVSSLLPLMLIFSDIFAIIV